MTMFEFKQLDELEQIETFWVEGQKVGERLGKSSRYILYQVNDFYVEIKYNLVVNVIYAMRSFECESPYLDVYLLPIDISAVKQQV
ncbi:hypothetical protein QWZ08_16495 [Ferruginibacter paludis]|uniref:hypothetical protein n=1 Tax=Ferruginibacter paludis TaxID=1310417 RepID=UPI0025B29D82|nr:hypothetical protein [Ferruginibacter paludis]MDN3657251.1 hypothetical protein [Ferruginibacter paludis]